MSLQLQLALSRPDFALAVELDLPGRGVTAVFGPSGSGKTTLLRALAGLERASGRVEINGQLWQDGTWMLPTHRRAIGYVPQTPSLFAHLDVRANLRYGLRRSRFEPAQHGAPDFAAIVDLLGIGTLLARRPATLSGGEQQRVAIARALLAGPRLLLLDEPLAALDATRKREILPWLDRLCAQLDMPVLYVSHAADEVLRLADHLVLLDRGRVLASGPLAQLLVRLDPPVQLDEEIAAVLDAQVGVVDAQWQLLRLDFAGGCLWSRDDGHTPGQRLRVRVLARDVSLACVPPVQSSIQNVLHAQVDAIGADSHGAMALVRLRVGPSLLLARLTRRAVATLGISVGDWVWAQVKSVALSE